MGRKKKEIVLIDLEKDEKFQAFLEKIKSIGYEPYEMSKTFWYDRNPTKTYNPHLFVEWSTGGVTGGSCWDEGDVTHHGYSSDNPPEPLTDLDSIIDLIKPDMTFREYRELEKEVVEYGSREQGEYYGNSTFYSSKKCCLKKLYDYFMKKGWLDV